MLPRRAHLLLLMALAATTSAERVCSECWPEEIFTHPAIGIEFGPSYGRAVFKWPNKTIEDLVTIPGNPEYLVAMLEIAKQHDSPQEPELQEQARSIGRIVDTQKSLYDSAAAVPLSILEPLTTMAQQLKAYVEFALFIHPIAILGVTYPVFFEASHEALLREVIRERVGFNASLSYSQTNTAVASASANGMRMCQCPIWARDCSEEYFPEYEMVLAIDYSDMFLTIFLYEAEHPEIWHNSTNLFVQRVSSINHHHNNSRTAFWDKVISALRRLVSTVDNKIDHLILSGAHASDEDLHHAIQAGVGGLNYHGTYYYLGRHGSPPHDRNYPTVQLVMGSIVDPVLAAAQGVADLSWRRTMRTCIDPCSRWRTLPPCHEDYRFERDITKDYPEELHNVIF